MGLFKSPWRSKVAAVAAFQSPEPPAEPAAPPTPPPPPGRDAATIVEEIGKMTDAVEAARVALARTGTIIPKMGFGEDLEAAEVQLDACEAKLDVIVRLGRTSAAATRRLGDAEKAGRRALAAAGAAADARVAAADAVGDAVAAAAQVRAAAAEDLLRAATAAHRRSTAVEQAVGAATAAFAAATTAAAAARLGARHVFAADAALEFEPVAVPASPEAPATPVEEAPATPPAVVPGSPEAPATPVEAEAETEAPAPAEEGDLVACDLGVATVKAVVRDGAAYVVEKRDNTGLLVVPSASCDKVAAPLTIKSPVAATKAAVHWRRSVKRYVDPETQYEYLYDEKTGESKWAAGTDWAVDPRLSNVARQIMARQKIVRAFRAKRSPVKAIRAVAAVARWQRYTDPETRQDYLYDEASGRSKWADGSAWTANPRLASVAREIMRRRRRSKDAAFAAAAGAVAEERLGREAAERRLRAMEKERATLDFKLRVALEATCGVDLPRLDRDFAGCAADCARMRLELMQERSTRAQSAARRRHANYGRRKTADGKIKREPRPLTPPHMDAADVTAQFLRDLGHPTTVIINRRGADQKPLWLKDAPW